MIKKTLKWLRGADKELSMAELLEMNETLESKNEELVAKLDTEVSNNAALCETVARS